MILICASVRRSGSPGPLHRQLECEHSNADTPGNNTVATSFILPSCSLQNMSVPDTYPPSNPLPHQTNTSGEVPLPSIPVPLSNFHPFLDKGRSGSFPTMSFSIYFVII
ncbi:hypothetical protein EI94DRAFT_481718 [Lactarius quietus]|nr:hypothetical protein EI94DRAFT_481718 [Lactarius quietus]